jgi:hypothetical protein
MDLMMEQHPPLQVTNSTGMAGVVQYSSAGQWCLLLYVMPLLLYCYSSLLFSRHNGPSSSHLSMWQRTVGYFVCPLSLAPMLESTFSQPVQAI